jgi:predicted nuclease with TOPRIM domain
MADYDTVLDNLSRGFNEVFESLTRIETRLSGLEGEMHGLHAQLDDLSRENARSSEKIDVFVREVIDLKRRWRKDA